MENLSRQDEELLMAGVKRAVDLVDNQDLSPNDAMHKVAQELGYTPGFLKAACNAFNTGRQLAQWEANSSILDKLADFPLADYDTVHNQLWGSSKEKVAHVSTAKPKFRSYDDRQSLLKADLGTTEKAASFDPVYQQDISIKKAFDAKDYQHRLVQDANREKVAAEDLLNYKLHLLVSYFQKSAYDRLPLAQVEHAAGVYYGAPGSSLMRYVASKFPNEKKAADHKPTWSGFQAPANRSAAPYTLIDDCITQAEKLAAAEAKLAKQVTVAAKATKVADDLYAKLNIPGSLAVKLAFSGSALGPTSAQPSFEMLRSAVGTGNKPAARPPIKIPGSALGPANKQANLSSIIGGVAGGFGMGAAKNLGESVAQGGQSALESEIQNLDSPEHLNELRKIRAQTALTQMMSDPENAISEYEPDQVLNAYNELVQLSPRLADQPAALGPLLRKRLMGNTEPFELGEMLKLEEGLRRTQSNPAQLMRNEASILS